MGPRSLRIPLQAVVAEACNSRGWSLPTPRSDEALNLHTHLTTINPPTSSTNEDVFDWCIDGNSSSNFSSCNLGSYEAKGRIEKLVTSGSVQRFEETRDHILLTCEYSCDVWGLVLTRFDPPQHMFRSWFELLSWIKESSTLAQSLLRKLVIQTTIFYL